MTEPIPQPPALPLIGNVRDLDPEIPLQSLWRICEEYGPIFKLNLLGREVVFIGSYELLNEVW